MTDHSAGHPDPHAKGARRHRDDQDPSHPHDHHDHRDPASPALRAEALELLLAEKGLVDPAKIDEIVERYEKDVGPLNGARVVARAWVDADYKQRLLADGNAAVRELGIDGSQIDHLVVKENTAGVHNVVVCTLCSCYPWAVLGLPPSWYKDPAYRSRVVREPRAVLAEMGLDLEPDTEVRVWDSSAEVRYLVLPARPVSTEGLSEEELAALVVRDSMIGVARIPQPATGGRG
jgi:nitrile hydratase